MVPSSANIVLQNRRIRQSETNTINIQETKLNYDAARPSNTSVLVSIVVSIPACHAGDRGSIPRLGDFFFSRN